MEIIATNGQSVKIWMVAFLVLVDQDSQEQAQSALISTNVQMDQIIVTSMLAALITMVVSHVLVI